MIQSFADQDTEELFIAEKNRRSNAIARVALRKLIQMNQARELSDLAVPPGDRLEALRGIWRAFIPFALTISGGSFSDGLNPAQSGLPSLTPTDRILIVFYSPRRKVPRNLGGTC